MIEVPGFDPEEKFNKFYKWYRKRNTSRSFAIINLVHFLNNENNNEFTVPYSIYSISVHDEIYTTTIALIKIWVIGGFIIENTTWNQQYTRDQFCAKSHCRFIFTGAEYDNK
jgi:hypothetical protein